MRNGYVILMVAAGLMGFAPRLQAHDQHCHKRNASGKMEDLPNSTDAKACAAAGGEWVHHHKHCHKKGADGKIVDDDSITSAGKCKKAGGTWSDHGHEEAHS